ncbi:MAG: hemerythrin domain-containing protein [Planctomycetes bacterium]|nr:hemerythrin domain-containing protein [Planctomycetota bacterium]
MADYSIDDALSHDHEKLDALLKQVESAIASHSGETGKLTGTFIKRLAYHMTWEENVLFPAVQRCCSCKGHRSIESLVSDHERIQESLDNLKAAIEVMSWDLAKDHLDNLKVLLQGHNYDEERGVYLDADRLLDNKMREEYLKKFQEGFLSDL